MIGRFFLLPPLIAAIGFAALSLLPGWLSAEEKEKPPLYETVQPGILSIALYQDFFPFSFIENETEKGIDLEIALAIAQKLGLKPKTIFFTADENVDDDLRNFIWRGTSVERGRVADVMMHVPYDRRIKWNNELVGFFAPYHSDVNALLVPLNDDFPYRDMKDLAEYTLGVEIDTLADFILLSHDGGKLAERIHHYPSPYALFEALANGEVNAASAIETQLLAGLAYFDLQEKFEVRPMDRTVHLSRSWTVGVAVSFNRLTLGYEIEAVMEELNASGKLNEIYGRYGLDYRFE